MDWVFGKGQIWVLPKCTTVSLAIIVTFALNLVDNGVNCEVAIFKGDPTLPKSVDMDEIRKELFVNRPRQPRQDDGDDGGDDGDGDGAGAGGGAAGAGGLGGAFMQLFGNGNTLNTLVQATGALPQLFQALTQVSSAANMALNGTDTPNLPSFFFKQGAQAANLIQQITQNGQMGQGAQSITSIIANNVGPIPGIPGGIIPGRGPPPGALNGALRPGGPRPGGPLQGVSPELQMKLLQIAMQNQQNGGGGIPQGANGQGQYGNPGNGVGGAANVGGAGFQFESFGGNDVELAKLPPSPIRQHPYPGQRPGSQGAGPTSLQGLDPQLQQQLIQLAIEMHKQEQQEQEFQQQQQAQQQEFQKQQQAQQQQHAERQQAQQQQAQQQTQQFKQPEPHEVGPILPPEDYSVEETQSIRPFPTQAPQNELSAPPSAPSNQPISSPQAQQSTQQLTKELAELASKLPDQAQPIDSSESQTPNLWELYTMLQNLPQNSSPPETSYSAQSPTTETPVNLMLLKQAIHAQPEQFSNALLQSMNIMIANMRDRLQQQQQNNPQSSWNRPTTQEPFFNLNSHPIQSFNPVQNSNHAQNSNPTQNFNPAQNSNPAHNTNPAQNFNFVQNSNPTQTFNPAQNSNPTPNFNPAQYPNPTQNFNPNQNPNPTWVFANRPNSPTNSASSDPYLPSTPQRTPKPTYPPHRRRSTTPTPTTTSLSIENLPTESPHIYHGSLPASKAPSLIPRPPKPPTFNNLVNQPPPNFVKSPISSHLTLPIGGYVPSVVSVFEGVDSQKPVGPQPSNPDASNGFGHKQPYSPIIKGVLIETPRLRPSNYDYIKRPPSGLVINTEDKRTTENYTFQVSNINNIIRQQQQQYNNNRNTNYGAVHTTTTTTTPTTRRPPPPPPPHPQAPASSSANSSWIAAVKDIQSRPVTTPRPSRTRTRGPSKRPSLISGPIYWMNMFYPKGMTTTQKSSVYKFGR